MKFSSKLPNLEVTIFTVMTKLALEHDAINLSQGFPDFEVHPDLVARVTKYMQEGHNQYAPMQGVQALREQIAAKVSELYGADYDPATEVTVTSGATEALFAAISAVVRKDDEVIVFEPAYDAYVPAIDLSGGIPVYVKLQYPEYRIDWKQLKNVVTKKTRLIILNFPHNPTGAVLSAEDIRQLIEIFRHTDAFIVSDEVYEHIIFDGLKHESLAKYPELAERSFVVSSFGKTYHTTGWKIGYCLAPAFLSKEFQKIHQYLTFASNTPVQCAYADFMQNKSIYMDLPAFYQKKRDKFLALIKPSRFKALPCKGTYFQLLDYSQITTESDIEFAKHMTAQQGVAAIPLSVYITKTMIIKCYDFVLRKKTRPSKALLKDYAGSNFWSLVTGLWCLDG